MSLSILSNNIHRVIRRTIILYNNFKDWISLIYNRI